MIAEREGGLGHLTLNRPAVLNALNLAMIRQLAEALAEWDADPAVRTLLLDGAGDRGLCAGGDLHEVYRSRCRPGDRSAFVLWEEEYRLDLQIASLRTPYVAIMDGLVMGGGVGLSAHGRHRVVTERTRLAMPEVGIGLVPDVGATFLLARAPGALGTYVALTGDQLGPADAVVCGLADYFIETDAIAELIAELRSGTAPPAALARAERASAPSPPSELVTARPWIDACFGAPTAEAIIERLLARDEAAARASAATLLTRSPTALKVTLRAIRRAAHLDSLAACLQQDYRLVGGLFSAPDMAEGIRAAVVDKDRKPRWDPARLDEVTDQVVDGYFRPGRVPDLRLTGP